jgi:hypothetical protein
LCEHAWSEIAVQLFRLVVDRTDLVKRVEVARRAPVMPALSFIAANASIVGTRSSAVGASA